MARFGRVTNPTYYNMKLQNQSAIVTGGSRGIGRAIVLRLAQEGADVLFTYSSNDEAAQAVITEVESLRRKAIALKADAASASGAEEVVKTATEVFGKIDILVNNAGVTRDTLLMRMSEEDWDTVLDTNL